MKPKYISSLMSLCSKKVVLISSGQPSINPRLVKEADTLSEHGMDVTVLYQYWSGWATDLDKNLLCGKVWAAWRVGGDPVHDKWSYRLSRLRHKASSIVFSRTGNLASGVRAISRSSMELIRAAKRVKADLYIGHNLGALPAAVLAAEYHGAKCGFDAEDFHRNEIADEALHPDVLLKKKLEDHFYPRLNYLSTASPLITDQYRRLYPELNVHTINNVFPSTNVLLSAIKRQEKKLKLFWFSQTIGPQRGLEDIIRALARTSDLPVELHLLGNVTATTKRYLEKQTGHSETSLARIFYHEPIDADKIINFAAQFDIGLATETGAPFNRNICLTNKIFTYMQAGLAILASDTMAQEQLLRMHPEVGDIYKRGDVDAIARVIRLAYADRERLRQKQEASLKLARTRYNWELESQLFLNLVNNELQ